MPEINEVTLSRIQDAFIESFESGMMITGADPERPGQVRVEGVLSLPKGVVKLLLGDLFEGPSDARIDFSLKADTGPEEGGPEDGSDLD